MAASSSLHIEPCGGTRHQRLNQWVLVEKEEDNNNNNFTVRLENSNRLSIYPYVVQKSMVVQIGQKPINVRGKGEYYCVKVATEQENEKMKNIKQIEPITCEVAKYELFNTTKSLIYVYNQSSDNSAYLKKKELMEKFPISSAEKAK